MSDYKIQWLGDEHNRQFNSVESWIYIGIDTDRTGRFKIGLTTGELKTRDTSSQNPDYTILVGFKVKVGVSRSEILQIESAVLTELAEHYIPINHYNSGGRSEWFYGDPHEARNFVHDFLYENYSCKMNCYYCNIRDRGVIYGWENERYLYGKNRNAYCVNDLSNPPENPDCSSYGGCGDAECETCGDKWFLKRR